MILNERVRGIRDRLIKNNFVSNLYYGILQLPRERFLKKEIDRNIEEGKKTIIIERSYFRKLCNI